MKNIIKFLIKHHCPGDINKDWALEKHENCKLISEYQCAKCWANIDEKIKETTQNKPSLHDNPLDGLETLDESRLQQWKENITKFCWELSKNAEVTIKKQRKRNIETAKLSKTYVLGKKKLKETK